ncbi:MAG: DUF1266 domain-containing protein [Bacteroidota bacterium]
MNEASISPYFIALLGVILFYLGLRGIRQRKIMGAEGKEQGLKSPAYYFKIPGTFLGSAIVFFWGGSEFFKLGGWLYLSAYLLVLIAIGWWLIRFNQIRTSAKEGFKRVMIPNRYSKAKANSPHMWSMAAIALLSKVHKRKYFLLGGANLSNASIRYAKKRLKKEWDIEDKEDFDEIQDWLITVGHRAEFHELIEKIMNSSYPDIQDYLQELSRGEHGMQTKTEILEEKFRVEMIQDEGSKLKNQGFLAWDQLRYMENCGLGYLAGYLEEEMAWENLNSVAQVLQSRYDSWKDLGEAYLMAREFWSVVDYRKRGSTYEKAFDRLLSDKKSPWNQISWEMPLI